MPTVSAFGVSTLAFYKFSYEATNDKYYTKGGYQDVCYHLFTSFEGFEKHG